MRFLRKKEEFCSAAHRNLYKDLMGRAVGAMGPSKSPPAPLARFVPLLQPREACIHLTACVDDFGLAPHSPRVLEEWPVAIPLAGSGTREPARLLKVAGSVGVRRVAIWPRPAALAVHAPSFAIAAETEFASVRQAATLRATRRAGPAPSLQPAPAESWMAPSACVEAAATVLPVAFPMPLGLASTVALTGRPRYAALLHTGGRELSGGAEQPHAGTALLPLQSGEKLPRFDVTACFEPLAAPVESPPRPPASEAWMTSPAATPAARMVLPSMADAILVASRAPAIPPAMQSCSPVAAALRLPACAGWKVDSQPEAVWVEATPSMVAETALAAGLQLPRMPAWQAKDSLRGAHAGPVPAPAAAAVESFPIVEPRAPAPAVSVPPLSLPVAALAAISGRIRLESGVLPECMPRPLEPAPAAAHTVVKPVTGLGRAQLCESVGDLFAEGLAGALAPRLRPASFVVLDFHCRPKAGVVAKPVEWIPASVAVLRPKLTAKPLLERLEDLVPPAGKSKFGLAKVVAISRAVGQIAGSKRARNAILAVAAGLFLTAAVWLGSLSGRHAREISTDTATNEIPATMVPVRRQPSGPVAHLRQAIADRAAVSWSDTFRSGMEAWGAGAKSWAPGWTRSADGYVQPGPLAIFRPTVSYTDYTLEFFGQIERKSMDWVVLARDNQNYYAMKFTVVQPGPRPVIAMAHYSVVGGKQVGYSETPLDVVVPNSRPMQVLVDVKGNRFTASVDGEEVDSWTDDAPSTGGVGFFAEAGEKARLYWMKVSRNEDFLGRVCAYLSGSPSVRTAGLWPQEPYGRPHGSVPGAPFEPAETLGLAAVVALRRARARNLAPLPPPNFAERRIQRWSL